MNAEQVALNFDEFLLKSITPKDQKKLGEIVAAEALSTISGAHFRPHGLYIHIGSTAKIFFELLTFYLKFSTFNVHLYKEPDVNITALASRYNDIMPVIYDSAVALDLRVVEEYAAAECGTYHSVHLVIPSNVNPVELRAVQKHAQRYEVRLHPIRWAELEQPISEVDLQVKAWTDRHWRGLGRWYLAALADRTKAAVEALSLSVPS